MEKEKVFVIINSYLIGDIILVNSLVQNIKRIYKNSKVVMLSSPKLIDICKNQQGVDDVVIWDRHGAHKGFLGMMKFKKEFPYKNIYAVFPIYGTDRPILLSWLLGAKYVLFNTLEKKNIFKYLLKTKYKLNKIDRKILTMQNCHLQLLQGITKEELIDCKIKYNLNDNNFPPLKDIKDYVVLCPLSSRAPKDMPYNSVVDLIKKIKNKVVILGSGKTSEELSEKLSKENLDNLIDLQNKTTIDEAAIVISNSKGVISVDTGLAHLACSLNKKITVVFYEVKESPFIPEERLYNAKTIVENQTSENILKTFNSLFN